MASIIKLLRSPKDEFRKEMIKFTIQMDPETTDTATIEMPVYEMGEVEDWLEWRKLFARLLTIKGYGGNIMSGPSMFRHVRILLAGDALERFNAIASSNKDTTEETTEAFEVALQEFTNGMLPMHTAKRVKRYLLEIQKPIYMSVSQFVVRLQQINSYFPYMPDLGGQNAMLALPDMKFVLEQAVPQAWRSALERSGQHEAMNFSEVEDYFRTLEHLEEETVRSGGKS